MQVMANGMVSAGDGTLLAADIYLPEADDPLPAFIKRTPYDKTRDKDF